jgi:hypothetical protein
MFNQSTFSQFARSAVLPREETRNYMAEVKTLLRQGYARKLHVRGRVFYALTNKALPLLEDYRQSLLFSAKVQARLHKRSRFYQALLGDLRFLDEKSKEASAYLFLGDWQLHRPVTELQLDLAKQRYWDAHAN